VDINIANIDIHGNASENGQEFSQIETVGDLSHRYRLRH